MTKKKEGDLLGNGANHYEVHNDDHTPMVIWGCGWIFQNKTWSWALKCVGQELLPKPMIKTLVTNNGEHPLSSNRVSLGVCTSK